MSLYENIGLWVVLAMLSIGGLGVALIAVAIGILFIKDALGMC